MKVLLSQEELDRIHEEARATWLLQMRPEMNLYDFQDAQVAKAQARHLLKVLNEPCLCGCAHLTKGECPKCMAEIEQEIG